MHSPISTPFCVSCSSPDGPFYRSTIGECYQCYLSTRGISSNDEFDEIMLQSSPHEFGPSPQAYLRGDTSVPHLNEPWERRLIKSALTWPELVADYQLASVKPSWFLNRDHQILWAAILASSPEPGRPFMDRFCQEATKLIDVNDFSSLMFALCADDCSTPDKANVKFYAACVSAQSSGPRSAAALLADQFHTINTFLNGALND